MEYFNKLDSYGGKYEQLLITAGFDVVHFCTFGIYEGSWAAILRDGGVILGEFSDGKGDPFEQYLLGRSNSRLGQTMGKKEAFKVCKKIRIRIRYDHCRVLVNEKWSCDTSARYVWLRGLLAYAG